MVGMGDGIGGGNDRGGRGRIWMTEGGGGGGCEREETATGPRKGRTERECEWMSQRIESESVSV